MRDEIKATRPSSSSLRPHPSSLLFIVGAFIVYASVLDSYFLSDDFVTVGKMLMGDWSAAWGREHGGFFRPLFMWSNLLDSLLWGARPLGYHVTNVLLHGLNSLLVYALAARLFRHQSLSDEMKRAVALAAGLLFLVHPSHTEAVSWIAGRADLLATLFCLTSLVLYLSYLDKRSRLTLLLALLSFALALLSKESAVSLPLALPVVTFIYARDEQRRMSFKAAAKTIAPFFLVLFAFLFVRYLALGALVGGYGAGQHLNFSPSWLRDRLLQASLRALLPALPTELAPLLLKPLKSIVFIMLALALSVALALLLVQRRRSVEPVERKAQNHLVLALACLFLLSLLPAINLRLSLFDTQGERFLYWPTVFTSILTAFVALVLFRNLKVWIVLMMCVFLFYAVSLYRTNQTWNEAAQLAFSIREDILRSAAGPHLLVVNAPDNLRGVPIYHNGLEDALRRFPASKPIESAGVLALCGIDSSSAVFGLKMEEERLSLGLQTGAVGFVRINDETECIEILERSDASLQFRLDHCLVNPDIFFFSRGRMYRVLDGGP